MYQNIEFNQDSNIFDYIYIYIYILRSKNYKGHGHFPLLRSTSWFDWYYFCIYKFKSYNRERGILIFDISIKNSRDWLNYKTRNKYDWYHGRR